ncbi:MAG: PQQ-like beta-propeller repeat protein [Acidobacteriota bacterium]|nr:PQQ-like beta-propeller repeat protein [Acidobacteriota bacterium]MDQ5871016.1 PQQ-like beta-propeller repeat protein [Acidobacteriota bacterium]
MWQHDTREEGGPFEFHGDPLVTDSLVVAGSDLRQAGALAYVYAFERETGAVRWKTAVGPGVTSDLAALGRLVFAVTLGDELVALDVGTGERVWSFASGAPNESFWLNSSPATAGDRIFFGGLNGTLYALDARSGSLVWKRELGTRVSTGVAAVEEGVYVGTSEGHLYRVTLETGEVVARVETESAPNGRLTLAKGCVLAFLGESSIACYAPTLERVTWTRKGPKPWSSSRPYVWLDMALAGNEAGELFAFRLSDGELVWSETVGGTIRGVGTSAAGLYVGTLKGEVHARPWPRGTGSFSNPP